MFKMIWNGKYFYAEHNSSIRADKNGDVYGGGGKPATVVQAPAAPVPTAGETAAQVAQARLEYDPQIAAQQQQLAEQYYPQQVGLQASLLQQFAPQAAGLQQQIRQEYSPTQAALTEAFAQQGLERLEDPFGLTPEEATAEEAIRGRQREQLTQQLRTRANIGGGLFGGRAQATEQRALTELEQAFAQQDISRRQAGAQTALQYAIPSIQQLFPQTQFPGAPGLQPPVGQGAVPSPDALLAAMSQQPQAFMQPATPGGVGLGILGRWGGSF